MGANTLPSGLDALFTLADDMIDGLHTHEVAVGIKQNTEAAMQPLLDDCRTKQAAFVAKKQAKVDKTGVQTVKNSNSKAFIGAARNAFAPSLGETWSTAWEPTGFPNQSTAIPSNIEERQALLNALNLYLTANPTKENAPLGVTAVIANTLYNELSTARSDANQSVTDMINAMQARDTSEKVLRASMRGLIGELTQRLAGDDPLWYAFGLVPPDSLDTPDQPTGLTLTPQGDGSIRADWLNAPRAGGYIIEVQVVGVDAAFRPLMTATESEATLFGLPAGAMVKVRVIAVNAEGDQSPPSAVVQVLVPGTPVQPVTLSGTWNVGLVAASLVWTGSTAANLQGYRVLVSSGSSFNPATAIIAGSTPPGTHAFSTAIELFNPGDVATFVTLTLLTNGTEVASNPITITRPV